MLRAHRWEQGQGLGIPLTLAMGLELRERQGQEWLLGCTQVEAPHPHGKGRNPTGLDPLLSAIPSPLL